MGLVLFTMVTVLSALINCSFINCSCSDKEIRNILGGAVWWDRSLNGVVSGCNFTNCACASVGDGSGMDTYGE